MQKSDEYLLELAIQGDGDCFGEIVRRWERRIYGFIRRYVGNSEEAKDLTQDTFTKAFLKLEGLSDPARFSGWLYKIALNECRMRFRRRQRRQMVSLEESQSETSSIERSDITPEREFAGRQSVDRLEAAFERLSAEQREVLIMKEFQGLRFHEIAEVLGIPVSTAKSRLYGGLKTLKTLMGDEK